LPIKTGFSALLGKNPVVFAIPQAQGAVIPKGSNTQYIEHPGEVVTQGHQAKLTPAFFEPAHQEVVHSGPMLECAEGVFNQAAPRFHEAFCRFHVFPVLVNNRFVLPALEFFVKGLFP
jgi:hypothetical protein